MNKKAVLFYFCYFVYCHLCVDRKWQAGVRPCNVFFHRRFGSAPIYKIPSSGAIVGFFPFSGF